MEIQFPRTSLKTHNQYNEQKEKPPKLSKCEAEGLTSVGPGQSDESWVWVKDDRSSTSGSTTLQTNQLEFTIKNE